MGAGGKGRLEQAAEVVEPRLEQAAEDSICLPQAGWFLWQARMRGHDNANATVRLTPGRQTSAAT